MRASVLNGLLVFLSAVLDRQMPDNGQEPGHVPMRRLAEEASFCALVLLDARLIGRTVYGLLADGAGRVGIIDAPC